LRRRVQRSWMGLICPLCERGITGSQRKGADECHAGNKPKMSALTLYRHLKSLRMERGFHVAGPYQAQPFGGFRLLCNVCETSLGTQWAFEIIFQGSALDRYAKGRPGANAVATMLWYWFRSNSWTSSAVMIAWRTSKRCGTRAR
jgi:hypothetical protein